MAVGDQTAGAAPIRMALRGEIPIGAHSLNEIDRRCLTTLAAGACPAGGECPEDVLQRLIAGGMVEEVPLMHLPLPMIRVGYRITLAGEAALRSAT
jgi:hypothetical protein